MSKTRHGFVPPFLEGANPQNRTGKGSHVTAPATSGTPRPRAAAPQRPRSRRVATVAPPMRILSRFRASPPHAMNTPVTTPTYHVFLSHRSADKALVELLKGHLERLGLSCWYDYVQIRPGDPVRKGLEAGIRDSLAFIFCVGQNGKGQWQEAELDHVLDAAVKGRKTVVPVLLPGATAVPDLPLGLSGVHYADFRNGFDETELGRVESKILGKAPADAGSPVLAVVSKREEAGLASGGKKLEDELRGVFGPTFDSLLSALAEGSALRRLLVARFQPKSEDPATQALELLVRFHREFLSVIGEFIDLHASKRTPEEKAALIELVGSVMFLAMDPDVARRLVVQPAATGMGQTIPISMDARDGICSILANWVMRRDSVRQSKSPGIHAGFGLDVPPTLGHDYVRQSLVEKFKIPNDKPADEIDRLLSSEIRVRHFMKDPVHVTVAERSLEEAIRDPSSPLSKILVFLRTKGSSIRPALAGEDFDLDAERLVSALRGLFS